MGKRMNGWVDTLSEQDIPALAVDWERIVAVDDDPDESDADAKRLDADATIGDLSEPEEDNDEEY
ncbi:hypothetical protein [Paenibacillus donghaensis]|uniref:Uncharacterized protein n=1 Tax=Paenibacillus donghaensis TaxID=414771 RepID=A0A2Z2KV48_9BACL|nr:hypothetical protein [Paenibacillus donghaensis]ASA26072.1 hypothetical protein B9T62_38405 [Paenibacillus donghaensis]